MDKRIFENYCRSIENNEVIKREEIIELLTKYRETNNRVYFDKLINDSKVLIKDFILDLNLSETESSIFDINDIISSATESLIEYYKVVSIEELKRFNRLSEIESFKEAFFYNLTGSKGYVPVYEKTTIDNFYIDIVGWFIDKNQNQDVTINDLKEYLNSNVEYAKRINVKLEELNEYEIYVLYQFLNEYYKLISNKDYKDVEINYDSKSIIAFIAGEMIKHNYLNPSNVIASDVEDYMSIFDLINFTEDEKRIIEVELEELGEERSNDFELAYKLNIKPTEVIVSRNSIYSKLKRER